jgi:hypothetical protein
MAIEIQAVEKQLNNPAFEVQLREALAAWENAPQDLIDKTVTFVLHLRDELVSLCREIEDGEQIEQTLAINYIELKSRWIAINTRVNYQTFRTGKCDVESAFRGTGVSMFLAEVETLISQDDISKITDFLAQPIRRAA